MPTYRVGILALQGNVEQHRQILLKIGADPVMVKTADHLDNLAGLILPGGESTTMAKFLDKDLALKNAILKFATEQKRPILGTCAGLILLAKTVLPYGKHAENVNALGLMDIVVQRNAYGAQTNSAFRLIQTCNNDGISKQFCASFIRAPSIVHASKSVQILAKFVDDNSDEQQQPVAVRQDNIFGLCFHPENSGITYFHEMFLLQDKDLCKN